MGGDFKIWDVLVDQFPGEPHKAFKPGTAAAANPVCMSCKSADHILDWAYLGDPKPEAKWSRLSKVNEFVKDTNHSLNCIFCHDPHCGQAAHHPRRPDPGADAAREPTRSGTRTRRARRSRSRSWANAASRARSRCSAATT